MARTLETEILPAARFRTRVTSTPDPITHPGLRGNRGFRFARWLLCLLLLAVQVQAWAQIELNGGTATAEPGERVFIPVDLVTDGSVVALQFDLAFDATVLDISSRAEGAALVDHTLDTQLVAPGLYRVVVTTTTVTPLTTERLMTLDIDIASGATPGDYPMAIGAVVLADANGGAISTGTSTDALVRVAGPPAAPPPGAASPPTPVPVLGLWGTLFLAAALAALAWLFLRRGMTGVLQSLAIATVLLGSVVRAALIPGDANGDGQVDAADIPVIVAQILERETAPGDPDCNQDTQVNVLDTICTPDVPPVNQPPVLQAIPDQDVHDGEIVALQALADDPDLPYDDLRWELRDGPQGVSLSRNDGSFLWVPTTAQLGANEFLLRVTDAQGAFDEKRFSVNVRSLGGPPSLADVSDQSLTVGDTLSLSLDATDPDLPDDTLVFSLLTAPVGMGVASGTGLLEWTPGLDQVGLHDVTAQVTDREGLRDITSFIVTVRPVNGAPLAVDDSYPVRITETRVEPAPGVLGNDSDPDGDALTAEWVSGPEKGSLVFAADGSFEYTPTPPDPEVQLELHCEAARTDRTEQTNGTVAVADVDGDGTIELVGVNYIRSALRPEFWVLNAEDCSNQLDQVQDLDVTGSYDISGHLGLLDIDGDGLMEIIGVQGRFPLAREGRFDGHHLLAVRLDGSPAWGEDGVSETVPELPDSEAGIASGTYYARGPTFADLDGDGVVEIVMRWHRLMPPQNAYSQDGITVYDSRDGSILWTYVGDPAHGDKDNKPPVVADLDLDGTLEIIVHDQVVDHLGSLEFEFEVADSPFAPPEVTYSLQVAVANFDDDAYPEVVAYDAYYRYLFEHDGTLAWQIPMANGARSQITVADLDADGEMEYAFVFGNGNAAGYLQAYDTDGSVLWSHDGLPDLDIPAVFWNEGINLTAWDANRDGAVDLVLLMDRGNPGINANTGVLVVDGRDGAILESLPFNQYFSGQSYVGVADVDGDGHGELIASFTSGGPGSTAVWRGTETHPTPPAPPIRNQWIYQYTHVAADGSIPARPRPHWLTPGLNGFNFVPVRLDGAPPETDAFTYRARDGALASNEASVTLELLPPGDYAPEFASTPRQFGTRGFAYEYLPLVVDRDFGDTFAFALTAGPPGMTLDPVLGRVRWEDPELGVYGVGIAVTDSTGKSAFQQYELEIVEPVTVPDLFGLTGTAADAALGDALLQAGRVSSKHHASAPVGTVFMQSPIAGSLAEADSRVAYTLSLGPGPEDTDGDGDGYTPNEGDCDDTLGSIHPDAADADGNGVDEDCDGFDGSEPVTALIVEPSEIILLTGERVPLRAWAEFADGSAQLATHRVSWSSEDTSIATVSAAGMVTAGGFSGTARINASLEGQVAGASVRVSEPVPDDDELPRLSIASPSDQAIIKAPVDILGTAADDELVRYELTISSLGEGVPTVLATGSASVVNGSLGVLDPTGFGNGFYTIRLSALDAGGNTVSDEITVQIEGQMKIGHFVLTYTDLSIPLVGVPISVQRQYDSRDRGAGEFGNGWRLSIDSVRVECHAALGEGWQVIKQSVTFQLYPDRPHSCLVSIPGQPGQLFQFEPTQRVSPLVPFSFLTGRFVPVGGAKGTLAVEGGINLAIIDPQPGAVTLRNDDNLDVFAPDRLVYTTSAGAQLTFVDGTLRRLEDLNGNVIEVDESGITHSSGMSIDFTRDASGRITALTDPNGARQHYTYSAEGNLASHTDREGYETRYRYGVDHYLLEIIDPLGRPVARTEYGPDGRVTAVEDPQGGRTRLEWDPVNRIESVIQADGATATKTFDTEGNVIREVDADGIETRYGWHPSGQVESVTNARGAERRYVLDAGGNILGLVNPDASSWDVQLDLWGNLTQVTGPDGLVSRYEYDARGNLLSYENAEGEVTRYAYDDRGNRVLEQSPDGAMTRSEYDDDGFLSAVIRPGGSREEYTRDAMGQPTGISVVVTTQTGTQRLESTVERDAEGRETRWVDPMGHATVNEFGYLDEPLAIVDPLGRRTSLEYTPRGGLSAVQHPDGTVVRSEYDDRGRIARRIQADQSVLRMSYSPGGFLEQLEWEGTTPADDSDSRVFNAEMNDLGVLSHWSSPGVAAQSVNHDDFGRIEERSVGENRVRYGYDLRDRVVSESDSLGRTTEYVRNIAGQVIEARYPDGARVLSQFDAVGRLVRVTNELGHSTNYDYNTAGHLAAVTDALGNVTRYEWDELGRLILQVDALGRTTRHEYDAASRRTATVLPSGHRFEMAYDASGNLVRTLDADLREVQYEYDAMNRLVRKVVEGQAFERVLSPTGLVLEEDGDSSQTAYEYDALQQLVRRTDAEGRMTRYEYDQLGRVVRLWTDASEQSRSYDGFGRLSQVTNGNGDSWIHEYDEANRLVRLVGEELVETRTYDGRDRLVQLEVNELAGNLLARFSHEYDAAGQRVRSDSLDGSWVEYAYDAAGRLVSEVSGGTRSGFVNYELDAVGNIVSRVSETGTTTYEFDDNDRLIRQAGPEGVTDFEYDHSGRLARTLGARTSSYEWTPEDRLRSRTDSSGNVYELAYDWSGELIRLTGPGESISFVQDRLLGEHSKIIEEHSSVAGLTAFTQASRPLASTRSGVSEQYLVDGASGVRHLYGASGLGPMIGYDAYGAPVGLPESALHAYRSERYFPELETLYLRARFYDPGMARFLSRDPHGGVLGLPITLHDYVYGAANPVLFEDPSGAFIDPASLTIEAFLIASAVALAIGAVQGIAGSMISRRLSPSYSESDNPGKWSVDMIGGGGTVGLVGLTVMDILVQKEGAKDKFKSDATFLGLNVEGGIGLELGSVVIKDKIFLSEQSTTAGDLGGFYFSLNAASVGFVFGTLANGSKMYLGTGRAASVADFSPAPQIAGPKDGAGNLGVSFGSIWLGYAFTFSNNAKENVDQD